MQTKDRVGLIVQTAESALYNVPIIEIRKSGYKSVVCVNITGHYQFEVIVSYATRITE